MRWYLICLCLLGLTLMYHPTAGTAEAKPNILLIRLEDEAITPVTARFIKQAIEQAEQQQAKCLVIMLDTPGGLVDATRDVVKDILRSRVPVVVYVAPAGARAASAGVFITMAGHVAAMAPGTNIGAAHPVQLGGLPGTTPQQPSGQQPPEKKEEGETPKRAGTPMEDKIINDTVAWARALAELRGRNAEWAERAVKESISVSASEAVKQGAVDLVAEDFNELLSQLDGRTVKLPQGQVTLQVAGAEVQTRAMWWGEQLLATIANPNLALLLLLFGFYGILFELYSPGWGVAGTVGVICLVLGFFALAVLPINYVGLALIVIALALFVAEAFVTSFGFLTLGGMACLIIGGVMLVDSPVGFQRVSLWMLAPVALAAGAISFFLIGSIVKAQRASLQTGSETMAGKRAIATEEFTLADNQYRGLARTHGELWKAVSQTPVAAGQELEIESRRGLTLQVQPLNPPGIVLPIEQGQRKNIA